MMFEPHYCGGAAKFRRKWTDHLEQSAACTTSTRAQLSQNTFTRALKTHLFLTARHR